MTEQGHAALFRDAKNPHSGKPSRLGPEPVFNRKKIRYLIMQKLLVLAIATSFAALGCNSDAADDAHTDSGHEEHTDSGHDDEEGEEEEEEGEEEEEETTEG